MLKIAGVACLSVAALMVGCSDDSTPGTNTPDSPAAKVFDAPAGSADAGPTVDAGANTVTATLTKAGEPTQCGNDGAAGTAVVTVNADNSIHVVVTYSGLSGAPQMGHIHFGNVGDSGPVVLPFAAPASTPVGTSPITVDFTSANYINGGTGNPTAPATYAAFLTALKSGTGAYVNLHTATCGNGEIRGEIPAIGG